MKQYTELYPIKISKDCKKKLQLLKSKYRIVPSHFVRDAIDEKLEKELPQLKIKSETPYIPF